MELVNRLTGSGQGRPYTDEGAEFYIQNSQKNKRARVKIDGQLYEFILGHREYNSLGRELVEFSSSGYMVIKPDGLVQLRQTKNDEDLEKYLDGLAQRNKEYPSLVEKHRKAIIQRKEFVGLRNSPNEVEELIQMRAEFKASKGTVSAKWLKGLVVQASDLYPSELRRIIAHTRGNIKPMWIDKIRSEIQPCLMVIE